MCYDLTSTLTTIASASASFVAILGGFIASKLISIDSERVGIINKINDVDDEINYRTEVLTAAQKQNDESDALDFIFDHIEGLAKGVNVEALYKYEKHPVISIQTLLPYWARAEEIYKQFKHAFEHMEPLNEDRVPRNVAMTLRDDDFGYAVSERLGKYFYKLKKEQERRNAQPCLGVPMNFIVDAVSDMSIYETHITPAYSYSKNQDIINEQKNIIGWLNTQRKQLVDAKESLRKPKGMALGLVIFALFSLLCIVCPLVCSPFQTSNYHQYLATKITTISIFTLGLIAIFGYLIWLLHWKPNQKKRAKTDKH